ncbi:MAG: response regulator [Firmicutes bacterium]|nr:response regulator [Bacillota bacterium]
MKKILIVDDALFMRKMLRETLEKNGYEIIGEAENGIMGIEKYKELRPDLITMDITMPQMDGINAIKAIHDFDPQAKIVVISSMGQEYLIREAITSGAKGFIIKPFKEKTVIETISEILNY